MKNDLDMSTRPWRSAFALIVLFVGIIPLLALTESNPYSAVSGRNVFSLKEPPVQTNAAPATTSNPAPGIELQGFTTILGRPQVLLKAKIAAKAPDPAKEKALVMEVGQQEGDIEIVAMDAYAGTVSLKNQGELVSLNLKDDGAKPVPGPAIATPPANAAPGARPNLPGVPAPRTTAGGTGVTTIGNAAGSSLPARPMRSGTINNTSANTLRGSAGSPQAFGGLRNATEQAAAIEVMAEAHRDLIEAGKMPPPPITGARSGR